MSGFTHQSAGLSFKYPADHSLMAFTTEKNHASYICKINVVPHSTQYNGITHQQSRSHSQHVVCSKSIEATAM